MVSERESRQLTKSAKRRVWKLQVMKSLSSEVGISIADIQRMLGKSTFDKLLDESYRAHATDTEVGTQVIREKLLSKHGVELGQRVGSRPDRQRP
jgi:hypothetical protein